MTTTGAASSGQASDSGGTGQAPQVNNSGSLTAASQGQAPGDHTTTTSGASGDTISRAEHDRITAELRKEAASYRTKNKQFEDQQAANDLAKLGDLERAQKIADDAQKQVAERDQIITTTQRELLDLKITRAIERKAGELGIIDPDAAARLIDWADLDFDDKGLPKNLDAVLTALLTAKPYLFAQAHQSGAPPAPRPTSSGGATNPGAGGVAPGAAGGSGGSITAASYRAMSPQERILRNKEVQDTLRRYGGRLPD
jgi:hypothetical protein